MHEPNDVLPPVEGLAAPGPAHLPNLEYLGFWQRVAAFLIDNVIASVVVFPLSSLADGPLSPATILMDVIVTVVVAVYVLVFWVWHASTPGKMLFKAIIVDEKSGQAPSRTAYFIRYLGYFPAFLCLGLGVLWIAWEPRKRGWHDLMAGTIVVRPRRAA